MSCLTLKGYERWLFIPTQDQINLIQITYFYFYFYQILTAFNKLKIVSEVARMWQLKTIKLAFDRWDISIECFGRAHHSYVAAWSRYCTREKRFLSLLSLTRWNNGRRWMHVSWLSHGWLSSVLFSNMTSEASLLLFFLTSWQVGHVCSCLQDCASSSVETCHQH